MSARLRDAGREDVEGIVGIHVVAFEGFFLTMLGKPFLRELYGAFIRDSDTICLVAENAGQLCGFVVGTSKPASFFRRLLARRWYAFVLKSCLSLIRHPVAVGEKLISALHYRGEAPTGLGGGVLLSSIAVAPAAAGEGVGKLLVEAFCAAAANAGGLYVYLTTDKEDNPAVNRFYLDSGFHVESSFRKHRNRWMNRYVRYVALSPQQ